MTTIVFISSHLIDDLSHGTTLSINSTNFSDSCVEIVASIKKRSIHFQTINRLENLNLNWPRSLAKNSLAGLWPPIPFCHSSQRMARVLGHLWRVAAGSTSSSPTGWAASNKFPKNHDWQPFRDANPLTRPKKMSMTLVTSFWFSLSDPRRQLYWAFW